MKSIDVAHEYIISNAKGRVTGNELLFSCPNHSNDDGVDSHPSFNYSIQKKMGQCLSCPFKGGAVMIARAMGWQDEPSVSIERDSDMRVVVGTYDYTNEDGHLLFQVVRYDPKDFRQRQPDGAGDWIWNLDNVRRVPYRLPEILGADWESWIYVAEGEKSVEELRRRGLVATTNSGGAGRWRQDCNSYFEGRRVVVLPDNDEAGRSHAQQVAGALHEVAAEVRVVELPGLPQRGDVCDWFAAGGTKEALENLANQALLWKDTAPDTTNEETEDKEKDRKDYSSAAEKLVELLEEKGVILFHDQYGEPHAAATGTGGRS